MSLYRVYMAYCDGCGTFIEMDQWQYEVAGHFNKEILRKELMRLGWKTNIESDRDLSAEYDNKADLCPTCVASERFR
jgi:hypothetical protein